MTSVVGSLISGHAALESRHFLVTHAGSLAEHSSQQQSEEIGAVLFVVSGVLNLSIAFVKERQHRSEKGVAGRLSPIRPHAHNASV